MNTPSIRLADAEENAHARGTLRIIIDADIEALAKQFNNQPLCFRALMLKILLEDLSALDHVQAFRYVRGIHDELCGQPFGGMDEDPAKIADGRKVQALAFEQLARIEIERQQARDQAAKAAS